MANPVELLRCAAENKRRRPVKPAPVRDIPEVPVQAEQEHAHMRMVRRPVGGHSAYSALMRSHDRVNPRIGR